MKRAALLIVVLAIAALIAWANWPESALPSNVVAESLVVDKAARNLSVVYGIDLRKDKSFDR